MATAEIGAPQPRRRLGRRLVFILMLLALLQLLAGGVPLLVISYLNQQNTIGATQQQAAERLALAIDGHLGKALAYLDGFVQDHTPQTLLLGQASLSLPIIVDSLLAQADFLEVWILDPSGQEVFQRSYHRFVHPSRYTSRAGRPEYQAIQDGAAWYVGPIHILEDPAFARLPAATLAVPIPTPKGPPGALLAELNASEIQNIIATADLGPGAYAYVVDREGILRVHWADVRLATEERRLAQVPAVQAFLAGRRETVTYAADPAITPPGTGNVVGSWAPLQMTDWGVIVERSQAEAFRGLFQQTIVFVVLLSISVLAAAGIGVLLARRLLRPLEVLRKGAQQLSEGHLDYRIELNTRDETETLAATLNQMAARLQSSREEIEAEVRARTQELALAYEQLRQQSEEQGRLLEVIRQMSTPVIPVLEGVVVMPLVGSVDSERAQMVSSALLTGIAEHRAQVAILDITGVPVVDTAVANALLQAMHAASLLGVHPILVGITPEVAQTVVQLGVDLSKITTRSTLQAGIDYALRRLKRSP